MIKMSPTRVFAIATLSCALHAAPAAAGTQVRWFQVNGSGACQSALPVFDVNIRKRPKAVQNEGDAPAFVTCSYYMKGPAAPYHVRVFAASSDGQPDTLTCTGVVGYNGFPNAFAYAPKTVDIPAEGQVVLDWTVTDFTDPDNPPLTPEFPSSVFGISCNLNPGVGINDSYLFFNDEIGL